MKWLAETIRRLTERLIPSLDGVGAGVFMLGVLILGGFSVSFMIGALTSILLF